MNICRNDWSFPYDIRIIIPGGLCLMRRVRKMYVNLSHACFLNYGLSGNAGIVGALGVVVDWCLLVLLVLPAAALYQRIERRNGSNGSTGLGAQVRGVRFRIIRNNARIKICRSISVVHGF